MSTENNKRRRLLTALTGVLVLLGAFQNCAGPGALELDGACQSFASVPPRIEFQNRASGSTLSVDLESNRVRLYFPFESSEGSACDISASLNSSDAVFIRDQLELLQFAGAHDDRAVSMNLRGSTLDVPLGDQIVRIWLERGDVSGFFNVVCTNPNPLQTRFESMISSLLESAQSCIR